MRDNRTPDELRAAIVAEIDAHRATLEAWNRCQVAWTAEHERAGKLQADNEALENDIRKAYREADSYRQLADMWRETATKIDSNLERISALLRKAYGAKD